MYAAKASGATMPESRMKKAKPMLTSMKTISMPLSSHLRLRRFSIRCLYQNALAPQPPPRPVLPTLTFLGAFSLTRPSLAATCVAKVVSVLCSTSS